MDLIIYGPEVFVLKLILYWIMTPGLVVSLKNYNAYSPINVYMNFSKLQTLSYKESKH